MKFLQRFATQLRQDATDAERLLWRHLRAHRFDGRKFRRQQPIGPYIVDFVCLESRVIVEVDGGQHMESAEDAARDAWLRERGYTVLRFWNNDVLANSEEVLERLMQELPPLPLPLSLRGRGEEAFSPPPSRGRGRGRGGGFTLIELVVTLAIIAVLATVALPLAEVTAQRTKEQDLRRALREIREAIDAYKQATDEGRVQKSPTDSGYPKRLEALADGVEDAKSPEKRKIYFLRRIPRDPMDADEALTATQTWGLRSYASPPDDPREGDDVFDVYSKSTRVGLNGIRYAEW